MTKEKDYKIKTSERDAIMEYFRSGRGATLPFGEVSKVLTILSSLEECCDKEE